MKRKLSFMLALAITAGLAASCGSEGNTDVTTTTSSEVTSAVEEDSPFVKDDLPKLDFQGADVTWFCGDYFDAYFSDVWAEDQNGNMVNDAIYNARRNVEERLNIKLLVERYAFGWSTLDEYNTTIKSFVMSGENTYDALVGYPSTALVIEGGYFSNLGENKYLNTEKPWWNKGALDVMPDENFIPFLEGDAMLTLIKHCLCVFFNQDLLDSVQIKDNIYELVRSGKWTLDKLESLIKGTYGDLNGNQEYDVDDRYGLTFGDSNKYRILPAANKVVVSEKVKDGYELAFINERTSDIFTRLQTLVTTNEAVRKAGGNNDNNLDSFASFGGNYVSKIFTSGNALFTASLVGDSASILDNSQFTIGMVPFPKYDESQDDYYTAPQRDGAIYILSTIVNEQFDRSGAVLEAWASECYRSVMPTYFETSLKTRYSTDNDMAEMFDLLRNNTVVNLDYVFSINLPLAVEFFKKINDDTVNFMSATEALRQQTEEKLAELVKALKGEQ